MTREETKEIVMILFYTYPSFKTDNMSNVVDAWSFVLQNENYEEIKNSIRIYAEESKSTFAPSVSDLVRIARENGKVHEWYQSVRECPAGYVTVSDYEDGRNPYYKKVGD